MDNVAFCDTETTGLDPDRHEIWEVGLIVDDAEYLWHLPVDLGTAEGIALKIGRFHERYLKEEKLVPAVTEPTAENRPTRRPTFAAQFAELTRGRHLVGAVISFDEERLRKLLRRHGACPEWHYHLVDVEALAAGKTGMVPPWDSEELSRAVGVEPDTFDRHTALGDARWAKAIYDAVMSRG